MIRIEKRMITEKNEEKRSIWTGERWLSVSLKADPTVDHIRTAVPA